MTVVLRYLEGMTQVETAELLGCSEGTGKSGDHPNGDHQGGH
jgi:DNA-directed RNA polymerase specialized sigma24 family protein